MWDILLVEDNAEIQQANKKMLDKLGLYYVRLAMNLAEAREMISSAEPDIIVLDIILPDGNGLDFLKELRQKKSIPVLILTALCTPEDVVTGLKAGGDDYLRKPYEYSELAARIETLLHRAANIPDVIAKDNLTIKVLTGEVFIGDKKLRLARNEFFMLLTLAKSENRFIKGEYLYEQVWGQKLAGDKSALKNAIYKLRGKLQGSGFTITAKRGEGYCFERL